MTTANASPVSENDPHADQPVPAAMKSKMIVRCQDKNGKTGFGIVQNNTVFMLAGSFEEIARENYTLTGERAALDKVKLLVPVQPSKIINFGWTYAGHATETGGQADLKEPFLFLKPPTSLIAHKETIQLPPRRLTTQVELEGEVALVVKKRGKNIKPQEAGEYIFGCTVFNDVTARDLTRHDPQFTRGKGFDTFGPLGPWIVTGIDPTDLRIITTLNGTVVQNGRTSEMSLGIPFLISWISEIMTLEPGDVLATGSPAGSCPMQTGDVVAVAVEGIGQLVNFVA